MEWLDRILPTSKNLNRIYHEGLRARPAYRRRKLNRIGLHWFPELRRKENTTQSAGDRANGLLKLRFSGSCIYARK